MKGSNTMTLNEATMLEAVQEWLYRHWAADMFTPQVMSIQQDQTDGTFKLTMGAAETE